MVIVTGFDHVVLDVSDLDRSADVSTQVFGIGATKSLYGADPDGNEFEVMWMLPRGAGGEFDTKSIVERLDLAAKPARWSGVRTAGVLVAEGVG